MLKVQYLMRWIGFLWRRSRRLNAVVESEETEFPSPINESVLIEEYAKVVAHHLCSLGLSKSAFHIDVRRTGVSPEDVRHFAAFVTFLEWEDRTPHVLANISVLQSGLRRRIAAETICPYSDFVALWAHVSSHAAGAPKRFEAAEPAHGSSINPVEGTDA